MSDSDAEYTQNRDGTETFVVSGPAGIVSTTYPASKSITSTSPRMSDERAAEVDALVFGDEEGNGVLPVMESGYACEPSPEALQALREVAEDWPRARAREAELAAVYLPLSVRNGGPDALARYYRQTTKCIADLQRERDGLRCDLEFARDGHANQVLTLAADFERIENQFKEDLAAARTAHQRDVNEGIEATHDLSVRVETLEKALGELIRQFETYPTGEAAWRRAELARMGRTRPREAARDVAHLRQRCTGIRSAMTANGCPPVLLSQQKWLVMTRGFCCFYGRLPRHIRSISFEISALISSWRLRSAVSFSNDSTRAEQASAFFASSRREATSARSVATSWFRARASRSAHAPPAPPPPRPNSSATRTTHVIFRRGRFTDFSGCCASMVALTSSPRKNSGSARPWWPRRTGAGRVCHP
jgi:hypothetical protein